MRVKGLRILLAFRWIETAAMSWKVSKEAEPSSCSQVTFTFMERTRRGDVCSLFDGISEAFVWKLTTNQCETYSIIWTILADKYSKIQPFGADLKI
jgi:hypothetical protein